MNRTRTYAVGSMLAAVAVGASLALVASSAGAAPVVKTITVTVQRPGVPDTTVGSTATGFYEGADGQVTTDQALSVYGPVWAIDNITDKFQVTSLGNHVYKVDRLAKGTFVAFAEPNTGLPTVTPLDNVKGKLSGMNSYVVTSSAGPDVSAVTSPEPLGTSSTDVLHQLFGADAVVTGGDTWVFGYHTKTSDMVQSYNTDPSVWGNITG